jgi:hypothetical protein
VPKAPGSSFTDRKLDAPLARLLIALYNNSIHLGPPPFPAIDALTLDGVERSPEEVELRFHDDELELVMTTLDSPFMFPRRRPIRPAAVRFADGTAISARLPALTHRRTNIIRGVRRSQDFVNLACWTWQPESNSHYWVAEVEGPPAAEGNLVVQLGGDAAAACGLRMESAYDLHLLTTDSSRLRLIVDTHGAPLDQKLLGQEVQALEFALGSSYRIATFLALDRKHRPVGAANASFDLYLDTKKRRCPVSGSRSDDHGYWPPVLASAVARELSKETKEDAPCRVTTTAYRDSLSGHVHKRYLLAQVALEAIAKKVIPKSNAGSLVKNVRAWHAWIKSADAEIRKHASDEESARILLNKLKDNVPQRPSGEAVLAALEHYGLKVPEEALKEIGLRNPSVHGFVMFKDEMPDANELLKRIAIIQTLLVALLAKYVGYSGPIVGWQLDDARWPTVPDWWPKEDAPEAHRRFVAVAPKVRRQPKKKSGASRTESQTRPPRKRRPHS